MMNKNEKAEVPENQKNFLFVECCFWFYHIAVIVILAFIMARVSMSYQEGQNILASNSYLHAQETVDLWGQGRKKCHIVGYIIDVKVVNTNNCPEGYSAVVNSTWNGTNTGCHCQTNVNARIFDFVLIGKCSSSLIAQNCTTIQPLAPKVLNMWKGGLLLCMKRASSMNFYNSIQTSTIQNSVSVNMTACASNTSYQVYTLPGVSCPISALSNTTISSTQTSLVLDSINNLNFNFASETSYPIAGIKISEYQFCEFINQVNISPNKTGSYVLEIRNLTTPCSTTDPRVITFDTLNEEQFYTDNKSTCWIKVIGIYSLLSSLPSFPVPSISYLQNLGYYAYPTWSYTCRTSSSFNLYKATSMILYKDALNVLTICFAIAVPVVVILAIILRLFFIIRHAIQCKSRIQFNALLMTEEQVTEQIPALNIAKSTKKETILFMFELLLRGALFFGILYCILTMTSGSTWIKQMIAKQCTDSYLTNIFRVYESSLDKISIYMLESIFLLVSLLVLDFLFFTVRCKSGDLNMKPVTNSIENNEYQYILNKEIKIEAESQSNLQESSQLAIHKKKDQSQVYQLDYLIADHAVQTKDNFFSLENNQYGLLKKKKKKKNVKKNTNQKKQLFKDQDL